MRPPAPLAVALALLAGCLAAEAPPTEAGSTWRLECPARGPPAGTQTCLARATQSPGSKIETWLSINPLDSTNVVVSAKDLDPAKSNACVWGGYSVTRDGGKTWTEVTIGGDYASRAPDSPYFGYACNTDPKHAFAPDGRLYAVVEMYGLGASPSSLVGAGTRIVLAASDDGGLTWPHALRLWESDAHTTAPDYPSIVVSPMTGTVVTTFLDFLTGSRCYVLTTRDRGAMAEPPIVLTTPSAGCVALEASPAGTFVIAHVRPFDGAAPAIATGIGIELQEARFSQSEDDARTWSEASGGFSWSGTLDAPQDNPHDVGVGFELAYDASGGPRHGTLYAIHHDVSQAGFRIVARASTDDGRTWTEPTAVHPIPPGLDQFMPNLAVAGDGTVHVFFFDESWAGDGRLVDLAHAASADGGRTWRVARVSSTSFDLALGRHQNGGPDAGEYIGVDALGSDVWVAVPESSGGGTTLVAVARASRS